MCVFDLWNQQFFQQPFFSWLPFPVLMHAPPLSDGPQLTNPALTNCLFYQTFLMSPLLVSCFLDKYCL